MVFSPQRAATVDKYSWLSDETFTNWIAAHLSHYGRSICEVGAGGGSMLTALKSRFSPIHLTEPSPSMLALLEAKIKLSNCQATVHQCGAETIPIESKSIDILLSKSSLHHFADEAAGIREMVRVASQIVAFVEVVAPDDSCLDYLKELVLKKEPGRKVDTIFTENTLRNRILPMCAGCRCLYFDQYIDLGLWLDGSDISSDMKKELFTFAVQQNGQVREAMQIHYQSGRLVQLRRMMMVIGVL